MRMNGPDRASPRLGSTRLTPRKLDETLEDYSRQIHRPTLAAFFARARPPARSRARALLRFPSKLSNFVVDVFDNGILRGVAKLGAPCSRSQEATRPDSTRLDSTGRTYFAMSREKWWIYFPLPCLALHREEQRSDRRT